MVVDSQRYALVLLPPGNGPGTHCTEGWVGLGLSIATVDSTHIIH